ncbi:MAG: glycosyltransferase, partial [Actinomycetota bacterium]|nr:glycosyltransferase [Actinomycetota bacterium]
TLVRTHRPAVVVALGGYASVPCALAAAALGVPVVVVEQNAVPGAANRLVGRFAMASAVPFAGTPLPRAVVTGNPVRAEILAVDRSEAGRAAARRALGLPEDRRVVGVFGGSLGALRLNTAVLGALEPWRERADLAVRHVIGERDWSVVTAQVGDLPPDGLFYQPVRYDDQRELSLAAADLVVSRAGGNTVAELAAVGMPSILVPLPGAPGDHQTANAAAVAGAGAAEVVPDDEMTATRLVNEVEALLGDPARLDAMGAAASGVARRDAAEAVAALVEAHAQR